MQELLNIVSVAEWKVLALPPLAVLDSGVLEISSKDPIERECSAEGRFRGGNGDMSVSLVSWARVSFKRRRLRLLLGVLRESSDTDFLKSGLSDCRERKLHLVGLSSVSSSTQCKDNSFSQITHNTEGNFLEKPRQNG